MIQSPCYRPDDGTAPQNPQYYYNPYEWQPYPNEWEWKPTDYYTTTWVACMNCMRTIEITYEFCPYCGQRLGPEPVDEMVQKMDEILEELKKLNEFQDLLKKLESGEALKHMEDIFKKYEEIKKE